MREETVDMREKAANTILFLTVGVLLAWSVICGIICCTDLTPDYMDVLVKVFIACVILRIIFINKYTMLVTAALITLSGLLVAGDILLSPVMSDSYGDTFRFFADLIDYILGYTIAYSIEYENAIVWALSIVIPLFLTFTMMLRFSYTLIAVLTGSIFAICFITGYFAYDTSFIVYVFCMFVLLVKRLNLSSRGEPSSNQKNGIFALAAVPVVLLCLITAYFIPKPDPQDKLASNFVEGVVANPFESVNDAVSALFTAKYFSLQQTGYLVGGNRLGGDAETGDEIVMQVITSRRYNQPKLAGTRKDKYTGYSWLNTAPGYGTTPTGGPDEEMRLMSESSLSYALLDYAVDRLLLEVRDNNFKLTDIVDDYSNTESVVEVIVEVFSPTAMNNKWLNSAYELKATSKTDRYTVNMLNHRTCTIFAPLRWGEITDYLGKQLDLYENGAKDLSLNELPPRNFEYTVEYNLTLPGPMIFMRDYTRKGFYTEMRDTLREYDEKGYANKKKFVLYDMPTGENEGDINASYLEDALTNILIPYAESVYASYLQLPENLSERITRLAETITADSTNDYDKVKLIERFLKNFEYTLTPGDTPVGEDFVDYFLFELQKGYCTSFASAFVVMCRSIGIPARYVEGYVLPPTSDNGVYNVTRMQGHAWGEAYFEGYGWETFEPTPSSTDTPEMYADPAVVDVFASYDSQYPNYYPDYTDAGLWSMISGMSSQSQSQTQTQSQSQSQPYPTQATATNHPAETEQDEISFDMGIIVPKISTAALILIITAVLFTLIRSIIVMSEGKRLWKKENNSAAIISFEKILKYLPFFHYEKYEHETAIQYANRAGKVLSFENDTKFMCDLAEIFTKAKYSRSQITDKERDIMIRAYKTVDTRFRSNTWKPRYIFLKYFTRTV